MVLQNKIVLITGATGGLGSAVTEAFLDAGASAAVTYTAEDKFRELESALNPLPGKLHGFAADMMKEASVEALVGQVVKTFGRIDALVNLVGGFMGGVPVTEMSEGQWDKMMQLNLKTAFLACKHTMKVMIGQKSGRIVNVGSKGGLYGGEGISAYGAAKAGVINLTLSLAAEGRAHNVTANAVTPGAIDTPPNRAAMPKADFSKWVAPASLAQVILFLCSEASRDVSGAVLPVFGKS